MTTEQPTLTDTERESLSTVLPASEWDYDNEGCATTAQWKRQEGQP
jgi:hypothetical protein